MTDPNPSMFILKLPPFETNAASHVAAVTVTLNSTYDYVHLCFINYNIQKVQLQHTYANLGAMSLVNVVRDY